MADLLVFGTTWKERASAMAVLEGILSHSLSCDRFRVVYICNIYFCVI